MLETLGTAFGYVLALALFGVLILFVKWYKSHSLLWQGAMVLFTGMIMVTVLSDAQLNWVFGTPLRNALLIWAAFMLLLLGTRAMMSFLKFGWMR